MNTTQTYEAPTITEVPCPIPAQQSDPELDPLVREIIGRVADKWTMLVLETLTEHGPLRFTQLGNLIGGVSQKMLTKTVRQMEADGLVLRTVYPVVPPKVEYALTDLGSSLSAAFCGVWIWAEQHRATIMQARTAFQQRAIGSSTADAERVDPHFDLNPASECSDGAVQAPRGRSC